MMWSRSPGFLLPPGLKKRVSYQMNATHRGFVFVVEQQPQNLDLQLLHNYRNTGKGFDVPQGPELEPQQKHLIGSVNHIRAQAAAQTDPKPTFDPLLQPLAAALVGSPPQTLVSTFIFGLALIFTLRNTQNHQPGQTSPV